MSQINDSDDKVFSVSRPSLALQENGLWQKTAKTEPYFEPKDQTSHKNGIENLEDSYNRLIALDFVA